MTISDSDSASPLEPPSLWTAKRARASYPALEGDHTADVAIVGGGIVGLTTALLLQDAGLEVVVLEARGIGRQVTGRSTAKVTSQHGLKYRTLRSAYGVEGAAVYARANQGAITSIRRIAEDLGIDCHFEPATAYAFARDEEMLPALHEEVDAAREAGLPARFTSTVDLPYEASGAVVFDEQAQFDPYAYLEGLARAIADRGGGRGTIFEGTVVTGVDDGSPCRVVTEAGSVTARDVVVATHIPMLDRGLYFARTKPRAHAVIAARLDGPRLDGMFISVDSPTRSFRSFEDEQGAWLIMLGETYTPGTADTEAMFRELEVEARERFPIRSVDYRWTNEDLDSADGLPLVGPVLPTSDHVFVATGFSAWGITNGTVAARVLADRILGATSPVAELFDTSRFTPNASARIVASEVTETVKGLGKRAMPSERVDLQALRPGEGVVGELHGERVAVSRDEDGTLYAVSAVCTHLGCVVGWNGAMKTWDCPCHGSSFARDGTVLHGPAVVPLSTLRTED